jgi:hypothetical protein
MPFYKNPVEGNQVYWLDDAQYVNIIPSTCVEITSEEASAIQASKVETPPLETKISPRQIRMALTQSGLRSQVEAAVAAGDQDMKDWYEFSTYFDRNHPQVLAMATALGVSDQELDALWALGATL